MSGIDAVIAQARRPGAFAERRRFSVARTQAIQKLRKFALADPYAYMLELIQSAVANGAHYIDIGLDQETMTLSYIGGGIPREALERLFDFLFAAKDRVDLGYVRELALGVNALMLFAPKRIVIESGDGTAEGTTRVELHGDGEKFDVGRPDHVLHGTFVRAEGMDRAKVARELKRAGDPRANYELPIVETRCLAAPVPIMFNGTSLFGYSTRRIPGLFGYARSIAVDEGELYGALGLAVDRQPEFMLLTRGVLIETVSRELLPGHRVGGIVCFDALRKTADHARLVRDDRFEELWLRLRPYAQELVRGGSGRARAEAFAAAQVHGGATLDVAGLRELMRERRRAVVLPPGHEEVEAARAEAIARALDAALLVATPEQARAARILGGDGARVFEPDLKDSREFDFYTQRPAGPPARPWVIQPVAAPALTTGQLVDEILAGADPTAPETAEVRLLLHEVFGEGEEVRATVYTPATAGEGLVVELRVFERVLERVSLESSFAGHAIVAELPDLRLGRLREVGAATIAEAIARRAAGALREAGRRVLESMAVETCTPGGAAAGLALAAAARAAVLRLRGGAAPGVDLALLEAGPPGVDLLALPLLTTLAGAPISLRELIRLAREETFGLVYGALAGAPAELEGLDARRIVRLDAASERHLVALVGEAAYVRVDRREACAEHRGVVCRDFAAGLRGYPEFPLLVEGTGWSGWSEAERAACLDDLLAQLLAVVDGTSPRLAGLSAGEAEELRRHALRHLQWFALRSPGARPGLLERVPLARTLAGDEVSAAAVLAMMKARRVPRAFCWHGPFPGEGWPAGPTAPEALELTPLVFQQLAAAGPVESGFDFEVASADVPEGMREETDPAGWLASAPVRLPGIEGTIGVPAGRVAAPAVLVYDAQRLRAHVFAEPAQALGVVGVLRSTRPTWSDADAREVAAALTAAAAAAMQQLVEAVYAAAPGSAAATRGVAALLEHAGRHLRLVAEPSGRVRAVATGEAAERILEQPLFPGEHGLPRSGWRVVQAACEALARGEAPAFGAMAPVLSDWCARYLRADRVARPTARRPAARPEAAQLGAAVAEDALAAALERWMHALRPDEEGLPWERRGRVRIIAPQFAEHFAGGLGEVDGGAATWTLSLSGAHWLVRWAAEGSPRAFAWLLLGCYGRINEVFHEVTGPHEQEFQRRVALALSEGHLTPQA